MCHPSFSESLFTVCTSCFPAYVHLRGGCPCLIRQPANKCRLVISSEAIRVDDNEEWCFQVFPGSRRAQFPPSTWRSRITVAQKTRPGTGGPAHAARLPREGQRGLPLARAIAPTQKLFRVFWFTTESAPRLSDHIIIRERAALVSSSARSSWLTLHFFHLPC